VATQARRLLDAGWAQGIEVSRQTQFGPERACIVPGDEEIDPVIRGADSPASGIVPYPESQPVQDDNPLRHEGLK
jgi:hypothetical protein